MKARWQDPDNKGGNTIQRESLAQHALACREPSLPVFIAQQDRLLRTWLIFPRPEVTTEKWLDTKCAEKAVAYPDPCHLFHA